MNKLMFVSLLALGAATAAFGETYYLTPGSTARGNFSSVDCWLSAGGQKPAYAPTSSSCDPNDTYIVKDGKQTRDDGAGTSNMQIYGRVIYGEIDGTAGNHYEESQYPKSWDAKLNFCHTDGAILRKGTYTAGNQKNDPSRCNRVMGKITVESPSSAPYVFTTSNSDVGRYIYFENAFVSDEDAGLMFNDSGYAHWWFKGALSGYKGSMTFAKSGSDILFDENCGPVEMNALSFAAAMTVTVANVTAPITAKTLTLAGGDEFKLSANTDGTTVSYAALACETFVRSGSDKISIILANFGDLHPTTTTTVKIALLTAKNGGLNEDDFDVDLSGKEVGAEFKGVAVEDVEGGSQALVATFVYEVDESYHLVSDASNQSGWTTKAEAWANADGEPAPYAITSAESTDVDYAVDQGRTFRLGATTSSPGQTFYGNSLTLGKVGGTKGTMRIDSQYSVNHNQFMSSIELANGSIQLNGTGGSEKACRFTASATVTAPATEAFKLVPSGAGMRTDMYLTLSGDEAAGLVRDNSQYFWMPRFFSDLSAYKGSMDFSGGNVELTFGANTGAIDLNGFSIGEASTVNVQNVSAPFKAKTLTVADGVRFNLSATTDGSAVNYPGIECETLVREGSGKIAIALADFGEIRPTVDGKTIRLDLLTVKNGGLSLDAVDVDLGAKALTPEYKGLSIVTGEGGVQSLAATFVYPPDSAYYLTAAASAKDPTSGCLSTATIWENLEGTNPPYSILSEDSSNIDFAVDQGRIFRVGLYTSSPGQAFYGNSLTFGRVGGTAGTLRIDSQYDVNYNRFEVPLCLANGSLVLNGTAGNRICRFSAAGVVTAPDAASFKLHPNAANMDTRMELVLSGERSACIGRDNDFFWKPSFLSDLSAYKGSMDFSRGNVALTFGADTGTIDLNAFSVGAASTVTVENVSAPFKAKSMTIADGTVFNLSAGTEGDGLSVASLEAESLALGGVVALRIASMPRIPSGVSAVRLVTVKQGTLDLTKFTLEIAGSGARHCKGLRVDETEEGAALVAVFEHPGLMLLLK